MARAQGAERRYLAGMLRSAAVAVLLTLAACGGSSSGHEGVSAAQAAAWPAKWCQTHPGMTRQQVVATMGEPTERFPDSMKWLAFDYRFSAFFNTDGTVRQLDADQQVQLSCASVRT